jgi:tetratricopeptide (TPR) repeat protein
MTPRLLLSLGLAGAFAWGSHTAAAEDTNSRAVYAFCDEALGHARKGEFDDARKLYAKAFDIAPSSSILFNLALAELNAGDALDALRHFRQYVQAVDTDPSKVERVQAEQLPKAFAATGHLQILKIPDTATLYLDGKPIAYAPAGLLDVTPGEHFIGARIADMAWHAHVQAAAGATTRATLELLWVHCGNHIGANGQLESGGEHLDAGAKR